MDGFRICIFNHETGEQLIESFFADTESLAYLLDRAMADVDGAIKKEGTAQVRLSIWRDGVLLSDDVFENDGGYGD